jgi:hypothetical protein
MSDENRGLAKKRTMVKDRVGCVRSTTRSLPEPSHTYGMKSPPDPEGAGEGQILNHFSFHFLKYIIVISNWITADPSASKASVRSHVHSNILAIKHGFVSSLL